jgi:hypothetical protein
MRRLGLRTVPVGCRLVHQIVEPEPRAAAIDIQESNERDDRLACFANEATQPPTFVAWFNVRSSLSSRWQARSIGSPTELSS